MCTVQVRKREILTMTAGQVAGNDPACYLVPITTKIKTPKKQSH